MRNSKLTFNGVILTLMIFSAIIFFFTIKLANVADRTPVNEFCKIEGSEDLAIRYSNLEPDGIYRGTENNSVLLVEGRFGYDWGCIVEGDYLYVNEYTSSDLGVLISKVVRINLNTLEKETLFNDSVLRGRCASGELVILSDYLLPANKPHVNRFCKLYNMTVSTDLADSATVLYLDPETAQTVYSVKESKGIKEDFDSLYLNRTLEEVMK